MCVLPNTCRSQTRSSCVSWWINQGSGYVLVVGWKSYRLLGADRQLARLAGETITVSGELSRSVVTVTDISEVRKKK
jgi:hypothetical protein